MTCFVFCLTALYYYIPRQQHLYGLDLAHIYKVTTPNLAQVSISV